MTKNEMVGWHHQLSGHEFEQVLGSTEGQRSLVCYSPWSHKESDMTERPNNNKCLVQALIWRERSIMVQGNQETLKVSIQFETEQTC